MVELPEAYVLSGQITDTLIGKTVKQAATNTHPHAFAMYTGEPAAYNAMLSGKKITASNPGTGYTCGGNVEIYIGDMLLAISTPIKYHGKGEKPPKKHQLLLNFTDGSFMSCTVQMWGCMFCLPQGKESPARHIWPHKTPSPLTDAFDENYFNGLLKNVKPNLSVKAFLATEQRIPGLGNGVLQDILFNARLHPKKKLETCTDGDIQRMYQSVKKTLDDMASQGGRDTEKDLFNRWGGYKTILSKNNLTHPCGVCGGPLTREAYLGGNIYYCARCQPL